MDVIARSAQRDEAIPATVHEHWDCFGLRPRNDQRRRRVAALLLCCAAALLLLGASCRKGIPKDVAERLKPVALEWWGVNETEEEVAPLIAEYQKVHPNVAITYRRFRYNEYERKILEALAEAPFRGPDLFAIPSSWSRKFRSKLLPLPATITMPFTERRGTVKKELYAELRTTRTIAPSELPNIFLDAIAPDAVLPREADDGSLGDPAVYGLPLAADTMVLYSNRDLLNAAGIPEPARTWSEFQAHVPRLTRVGTDGTITQAGAAIGTSRNVQRATDLLALLMMQNGAVMSTPDGQPRFHEIPASLAGQRQTPPGLDALLFTTDFADPGKPVYTWNAGQPDSLEAFLQGRVAYLFGYSYHLPVIRARAPRLNLRVSGVPHVAAVSDPTTGLVIGSDVVEGGSAVAVNVANIWLQSVAERTAHPNEAWDAITFMTTRPAIVERFLTAAGRPTALRGLVGKQLDDPDLKVFAGQLLTARTWYRGSQPEAAERALQELMDDVLRGADPNRALQLAAEKVNQTL